MKHELKHFIWVVGLGMGLTAYAFTNFTSKTDFQRLEGKVDRIVSFLLTKQIKGKIIGSTWGCVEGRTYEVQIPEVFGLHHHYFRKVA